MSLEARMIPEIEINLERLENLINSKILWTQVGKIYYNSVFIETLIHLKDLLIKADKLSNRISFTDDVIVNEKFKIKDVTGLICNFRDAACHSDTHRRKIGSLTSAFNIIQGKGGSMLIGDIKIENKYDDDIAFNMGGEILYLKRHVERSFLELKPFFDSYLNKYTR